MDKYEVSYITLFKFWKYDKSKNSIRLKSIISNPRVNNSFFNYINGL